MCIAMLLYVRSQLLLGDNTQCLRRLLKFPPVEDIRSIIDRAIVLYNKELAPQHAKLLYEQSISPPTNTTNNTSNNSTRSTSSLSSSNTSHSHNRDSITVGISDGIKSVTNFMKNTAKDVKKTLTSNKNNRNSGIITPMKTPSNTNNSNTNTTNNANTSTNNTNNTSISSSKPSVSKRNSLGKSSNSSRNSAIDTNKDKKLLSLQNELHDLKSLLFEQAVVINEIISSLTNEVKRIQPTSQISPDNNVTPSNNNSTNNMDSESSQQSVSVSNIDTNSINLSVVIDTIAQLKIIKQALHAPHENKNQQQIVQNENNYQSMQSSNNNATNNMPDNNNHPLSSTQPNQSESNDFANPNDNTNNNDSDAINNLIRGGSMNTGTLTAAAKALLSELLTDQDNESSSISSSQQQAKPSLNDSETPPLFSPMHSGFTPHHNKYNSNNTNNTNAANPSSSNIKVVAKQTVDFDPLR
jgi:hypothetical protein